VESRFRERNRVLGIYEASFEAGHETVLEGAAGAAGGGQTPWKKASEDFATVELPQPGGWAWNHRQVVTWG